MSNVDDVSLLAFARGEPNIAALKSFADAHQLGADNVLDGDITDAITYLANHPPVNLLLVEMPSAEQAAGLLDKLADVCAPDTKVVIIGTINEYSFFCWLQEIGIFHYLLKPLTIESLEAMYTKLTAQPITAADAKNKVGTTVGIIGTRGGSGASTFATLLAAYIADRTKKPTGLVELDPQDGSISLLLDLEASKGFRESIEKPDRIDGLFLDRVMVRATEHLNVLSSEDPIHENVRFTEEAADIMIPILKEKFAVTVLDVSHQFNPFSFKALSLCNHIFVVSPMNLQGLRDSMRIHEWLKDRCKITHHQFIGNRAGESEKHEVMQSDFEKSLGVKLLELIPYSPALFSEIGHDLKVLTKHDLYGFKQLENIAKLVNPLIKTSADSADKGKKNKLGLLKKK